MNALKQLCITIAGAALLGGGPAAAAPVLYTVSPGLTGIPTLTPLDTNPAAMSFAFPLGDGSRAFNGGVTYDPAASLFYLMSNDSLGESHLMTATPNGILTELYSAGFGFTGGLAIANNELYGIASAPDGSSSFWQLSQVAGGTATQLFDLGFGFNGGLTFNPFDLSFYAIENDINAFSRLVRFDLGGTPSIVNIGAIGIGAYGGLYFNPADGLYYTIASGSGDQQYLFAIDFTDDSITGLLALGQGFYNAGLTLGPDTLPPYGGPVVEVPGPDPEGQVPEPSTMLLMSAGLAAIGIARRKRGF